MQPLLKGFTPGGIVLLLFIFVSFNALIQIIYMVVVKSRSKEDSMKVAVLSAVSIFLGILAYILK